MIPSLPGYGFSAQPASLGWGPGRTARAWAELMRRLGYSRYVAQGGDVGAAVTDVMAIQAPNGLAGIHLNVLRRPPLPVAAELLGRAPVPRLTEEERAAFEAFGKQARKGYFAEQGQSPQTIGFALNDSPAGLAAWMLDHDADAYEKISRTFVDLSPVGGLTRDRILDNSGMDAFADRARRELAATGEHVRKRTVDTLDDLTPQEAQIAHLAAEGQTNPEIGGQLFFSPRTVEWHLRKGKLGISSRKELRTALSDAVVVPARRQGPHQ